MFQHENYDISEMREYLCTKFCSFVYKTTVQKCAALCCIYSTYDKLTEAQNSGTNFATAQKVDVIEVIERPIPPLLRHYFVYIYNFYQRFNILINTHSKDGTGMAGEHCSAQTSLTKTPGHQTAQTLTPSVRSHVGKVQ